MLIYVAVILIFIIFIGIFILMIFLLSLIYSHTSGSPFISNMDDVIDKALEELSPGSSDTFFDLGCGNGKVLKIALNKYKVKKAVGYEISPFPYFLSKINVRGHNNVVVKKESLLKADLSQATIIYLYLLPDLLDKLLPNLTKIKQEKDSGKPNKVKIASCVFEIKGLKLLKKVKIYHKGFRKDVFIYFY